MRITISIKGEYEQLINKLLRHRPHLKTPTGAIERALDFYLDNVIKTDIEINKIKKGGKKK